MQLYKKKFKLPKDYPGTYPPPPHIPLAKRVEAIRELLDKKNRKPVSLKYRILFFLGARIFDWAVRFIHLTSRQVFYLHPETEKLILDPEGHFIIALWHNRLFYTVITLRDKVAAHGHDILAIISQSNDAEFIARCTEIWGAFTARGSSTRGGIGALKRIIKYVRLHFHPLITPDGPKGPVYEVKDGLPVIAQMTGLPIVPMCYDTRRKWVFASWDRFMVPWPFSKVHLSYGEPIRIPDAMNLEEAKHLLKEKMMAQVHELEARVNEK
jgi:hypothetical protein